MMSKLIILFVFSLLVVDVFGDDDEWSAFKVKFNKKYDEAEENERRKIFEDNLQNIKDNNKKFEEGLVSYQLGINVFADLKPEELSAKHYTGFAYKKPSQYQQFQSTKETGYSKMKCSEAPIDYSANVPESIDWRKKGAVTDVKDQGSCNSCWAFSATGVIEGQIAIKTGKLVSLSEQQLVDCETIMSSNCVSGVMEGAFLYARDNGLMTSKDYPYEAVKSDCKANSTDKSNRAFVEDCYNIKPSNETHLKAAVALIGPISVAIPLGLINSYTKGIYDKGCVGDINHAVLVVGYDKDEETGKEYWIIKNSYGSDWGENGYLRLLRGNNLCGITVVPSYATFDEERSMQLISRVFDEL